jgi:hypothetical protein
LLGIVVGRNAERVQRIIRQVQGPGLLLKHPPQKWPTPATPGSRTKTLTQLGCPSWLFDADIIFQLTAGHVKAKTNWVIKVHKALLAASPIKFCGCSTDPEKLIIYEE